MQVCKTEHRVAHHKGLVEIVPDPVALDDLDHSRSRLQEVRVGQVGGVGPDKDACLRDRSQLLLEGGGCIELHYAHLQQRAQGTLRFCSTSECTWPVLW